MKISFYNLKVKKKVLKWLKRKTANDYDQTDDMQKGMFQYIYIFPNSLVPLEPSLCKEFGL